MKETIFVIVVIACLIVTAGAMQVNPERKQVMIATPEGPNIGLTATEIQRRAPAMNVIRLEGNVEIHQGHDPSR